MSRSLNATRAEMFVDGELVGGSVSFVDIPDRADRIGLEINGTGVILALCPTSAALIGAQLVREAQPAEIKTLCADNEELKRAQSELHEKRRREGETTITAYHECESWRVLDSEERRALLSHLLKAEAAEGVLELVRGDWSETMTEVLVGLGQIVGVDHE